MSIAYTIAGFSVGAIVGLTGVGGGSLMTPPSTTRITRRSAGTCSVSWGGFLSPETG